MAECCKNFSETSGSVKDGNFFKKYSVPWAHTVPSSERSLSHTNLFLLYVLNSLLITDYFHFFRLGFPIFLSERNRETEKGRERISLQLSSERAHAIRSGKVCSTTLQVLAVFLPVCFWINGPGIRVEKERCKQYKRTGKKKKDKLPPLYISFLRSFSLLL